MYVIYANREDKDFDYVCEDDIVYGSFFMGPISRAKFFTTKQDAEEFADTLYDDSNFNVERNLFVAQLTVKPRTTEYVGYFGKALKRFGGHN